MRSETTLTDSASERRSIVGLIALTVLVPMVMYGVAASIAPSASAPPFRDVPRFEQLVLAGAVYPIKLAYMALASLVVGLLWKQASPSLAALRWAMIFFLVGELICWINILAFFEEHLLLEYLHSWGMVVCFGFLVFAIVEALDSGVFHYSAPNAKCALVGVCQGCAKHTGGPCLLERLFKWMLPLALLVGWMPLSVPIAPVSYNTLILGVARNLSHSTPMLWYEIRYAPLAGLALMGAAWLMVFRASRGRESGTLRLAKILLAGGVGHLGFAFLRLAFFAFYRDNLVWFVFWEEFTELILVTGVLVIVWLFHPELPARWLKVVVG